MRRSKTIRSVTVASLAIALCMVATEIPADEPAGLPYVYTEWKQFTVADGLPNDHVFAIKAQGHKIWIGTENGLACYDKRTGEIKSWKEEDGLPWRVVSALAVAPGKPLVNSVNGEEASLARVLPLVKEHGAAVIGLAMDDDGIPADAESRARVAETIVERAAKLGIPAEDIVIDPLVLTVGADPQAGAITLQTIELVRERLGVNINLGATNVSFGLPERHTINQAFLALSIAAGANCMITDPAKLALAIRAAELLLGRDDYAARYIGAFRRLTKLNG